MGSMTSLKGLPEITPKGDVNTDDATSSDIRDKKPWVD